MKVVSNAIKRSEIDFKFEKIGRAPEDRMYFYYNQAVIAVDDNNFVFECTSTRPWKSVGQNGYNVFRKLYDAGEILYIIFDELEPVSPPATNSLNERFKGKEVITSIQNIEKVNDLFKLTVNILEIINGGDFKYLDSGFMYLQNITEFHDKISIDHLVYS